MAEARAEPVGFREAVQGHVSLLWVSSHPRFTREDHLSGLKRALPLRLTKESPVTFSMAAPIGNPPSLPILGLEDSAYQPGVCNIGPAEIARRRRAGNVGLVATVALFAILVALDVDPLARLLLAIPATIAASGYLQAYLKFCAGFGSRGVFNFGDVGPMNDAADPEARARDRARARRIGLTSMAIGIAVAVIAVALPI